MGTLDDCFIAELASFFVPENLEGFAHNNSIFIVD